MYMFPLSSLYHHLLPADSLLGIFFELEDGGDMLLRNISCIPK
jgi:hypothetical protein